MFWAFLCNSSACGTTGNRECNYAVLAPENGPYADSDPMYGRLFFMELWGTYFLTTVIMTVKYQVKSGPLQLNGFIIGLSLSGLIWCGGPTSGACFNPAVAIVQPIFQKLAQPA